MKKFHHLPTLTVISIGLLCLAACDHNVGTASTVYEDGSLDRTIVLSEADSGAASHNFMGVSEARGWNTVLSPMSEPTEGKEVKYNMTFTKHFESVDEANIEMNRDTDTVFQIRSSLKNSNRWFFTYMEYSDTYISLDRFKTIPQEDYFTTEDYAFIDRLPAEGSRISKSDSLYLARLNEKIFDFYGARTIFEEQFRDLLSVMRARNVSPNWADTLIRKKENIYQRILEGGTVSEEGALGSDVLSVVNDMRIPLPLEAQEDIIIKMEKIEKRLNFVSTAYTGKYVHSITMPWPVVSSNADSAKSNTLYWNPPAIKFLLQDYTMTARARKMNVWQMTISAIVVLATLGLFVFKRRNA